MHETVMKLVTTGEDQAAVVSALNELQQQLLRMKVDNVTPKKNARGMGPKDSVVLDGIDWIDAGRRYVQASFQ